MLLEYEWIDFSDRIDAECDNWHYWYFQSKVFRFEPYVCHGFHDLMQNTMNVNDIVTVSVKGSDYRIHFLI